MRENIWIWIGEDGVEHKVREMTTKHLYDVIKMFDRGVEYKVSSGDLGYTIIRFKTSELQEIKQYHRELAETYDEYRLYDFILSLERKYEEITREYQKRKANLFGGATCQQKKL